MKPFPCTQCGACCRQVHLSPETAFLDRGDNVCQYFDEVTNLCDIYEYRPMVCRVEEYYQKYLSNQFEWQEFIDINLKICKELEDNLKSNSIKLSVINI